MRETNKIIKVDKVIQEEVTLNKEQIAKYTVDKSNESLTVELLLTGDDTSLIDKETHRFFGSEFINEPTEEQLRELIDRKRVD